MMTGIIEGMINHVLESRQESCTADYKTRQKDYPSHKGMDFVNAAGGVCAVVAVADGVVDSCRNDIQGVDHTIYTAGNFVRIKHPNGTYTRYLHLAPGSVCVQVGQTVRAGDKLGIEGQTGDSYGVHLHFDVYVRGEYVDPLPYLMGEKGFGVPPADEPEDEPVTPNLRKGDEVTLSKAPLYVSSTAAKKSGTVSGTYYIHGDGIINSRIRITTPKGNTDCTGWVYVADCKATKSTEQDMPTSSSTLKLGDKVKVKHGAKTYDGKSLASFVYDNIYTVMQVGTSKNPDYIVISVNGQVTAAVKAVDLTKA